MASLNIITVQQSEQLTQQQNPTSIQNTRKPQTPFSGKFFSSSKDTLSILPDPIHRNFPISFLNFFVTKLNLGTYFLHFKFVINIFICDQLVLSCIYFQNVQCISQFNSSPVTKCVWSQSMSGHKVYWSQSASCHRVCLVTKCVSANKFTF